jgi:hypothetical protein
MTGIVASLCRCGFDHKTGRHPVRKTGDRFVFAPSDGSYLLNNAGLPALNRTTPHRILVGLPDIDKPLLFCRRDLGLNGPAEQSGPLLGRNITLQGGARNTREGEP